jgi:uncharacterized protein YndB with AHSA1/START domain
MPDFIDLTHFRSAPSAPWTLRRKEVLPASPQRVWQALVDPQELIAWWCDQAIVEASVGGRYEFHGPHVYGDSGRHKSDERNFEILELVPESHLEYRWCLEGVDTRVRYEISNVLEGTELVVLQTADRAPRWDPGSEAPNWWWVALPALRSHVEKGRPDLRLNYEKLSQSPSIVLQVGVTTFPWIVWDKLTSPPALERWWARHAEVDLRPGGPFRLGLEGWGPSTVLEVEAGRRLTHDWKWLDGTLGKVEWSVEETEEETRVSVSDTGPWHPDLPRECFLTHWAATLLSLKQMSERGTTPRDYQH